MNAESAWRRSRKTSGRRHLKDSATDLTEWAASLDLLPRLRAIVDELDLLDADEVDVPSHPRAGPAGRPRGSRMNTSLVAAVDAILASAVWAPGGEA